MKSALRTLVLLLVAPSLLGNPPEYSQTANALAAFPRLTLWAWEMPERLEFIDPAQIAVAYLDQTLYVDRDVHARPRLQPMRVPPGTRVMAVVRLEMPATAQSSPEIQAKVAAAILRSARRPGIAALQLDFDAVRSQRAFYGNVIRQVRREMPPYMPLSVTALASWCAFDHWIRGLPVDEAVPMLFRMGKEQNLFRLRAHGSEIREALCAHSLGVSADEPWPAKLGNKRLYVFDPQPWTRESLARVLEQMKK